MIDGLRQQFEEHGIWYRSNVFVKFRKQVRHISARGRFVDFIVKNATGKQVVVIVNGNEPAYHRPLIDVALAESGYIVLRVEGQERPRGVFVALNFEHQLRTRESIKADVDRELADIRRALQVTTRQDEVGK